MIDLATWLCAHGHKVIFAGEPEQSTINPEVGGSFVPLSMQKVSRADGNIALRIVALLRAAMILRGALSRQPVDLIHAHETAPALVARLAAFGKNIPVVMTFHGSAPERIRSAAQIAKFCADLTVSPSRISLDAMIAAGVDPKKARVLGLGIKPLPDTDPANIELLRATYLPDTGGTLIFSPSRLDPQKGIDLMIEVAKRVMDKHPNTVFVVAGGGPLTDKVDAWARAAGVDKNMHFIGPIDTVPAHLKAADIFLLTSRWEALPISIVEAFRAGLPVVATDCGGVSELIDDDVGVLCPIEDASALTEAVLEFVESQALRKSKGAAALERSQDDRFNGEVVHARFEAAYEELISRRV